MYVGVPRTFEVMYASSSALEFLHARSGIFVFTHGQWHFSDTSVGWSGWVCLLKHSGFISYLICLHSFHGQWQSLIRR